MGRVSKAVKQLAWAALAAGACAQALAGGETLMREGAPGAEIPPLADTLQALHLRGFGATALFARTLPEGLQDLNLSANDLPALPEGFVPKGVRRLWLADNRLAALPADAEQWKSLVYLNLDRNRLETLPPLAELPLRWLRVNGNALETLPPLPEHLERLYAADNRLRAAPPLPGALRQITLAGNPIESLPEGWGAGLEMLNLSRCPLKALPRDLTPWRRLKVLNLSLCPLPEAERDRLEGALDLDFTTLIF